MTVAGPSRNYGTGNSLWHFHRQVCGSCIKQCQPPELTCSIFFCKHSHCRKWNKSKKKKKKESPCYQSPGENSTKDADFHWGAAIVIWVFNNLQWIWILLTTLTVERWSQAAFSLFSVICRFHLFSVLYLWLVLSSDRYFTSLVSVGGLHLSVLIYTLSSWNTQIDGR